MIEEKRDFRIDIAKGIGIFLVIAGHLVQYAHSTSIFIFAFHMPLFYFLSGYVCSSDFSKNKFWKRIKSLLIPYLGFSLFGFIISLCVPVWRSGITFELFFYQFLYNVQPEFLHVGQVWFLFSLIIITILFFITNTFICNNKNQLWFGFLLFVIAYFVHHYSIKVSINSNLYRLPFKIDTSLSAFLFFQSGYVFKLTNYYDKIENWLTKKKFTIGILALVIVYFISKKNHMTNIGDCSLGKPLLYLVGAYSGIFSTLIFSSIINKCKNKFYINWIGANSLPIFAFHSMYLYLSAYILSKIYGYDIMIMNNIPPKVIFPIIIFILIFSIPIVKIYKYINYIITKISNK